MATAAAPLAMPVIGYVPVARRERSSIPAGPTRPAASGSRCARSTRCAGSGSRPSVHLAVEVQLLGIEALPQCAATHARSAQGPGGGHIGQRRAGIDASRPTQDSHLQDVERRRARGVDLPAAAEECLQLARVANRPTTRRAAHCGRVQPLGVCGSGKEPEEDEGGSERSHARTSTHRRTRRAAGCASSGGEAKARSPRVRARRTGGERAAATRGGRSAPEPQSPRRHRRPPPGSDRPPGRCERPAAAGGSTSPSGRRGPHVASSAARPARPARPSFARRERRAGRWPRSARTFGGP